MWQVPHATAAAMQLQQLLKLGSHSANICTEDSWRSWACTFSFWSFFVLDHLLTYHFLNHPPAPIISLGYPFFPGVLIFSVIQSFPLFLSNPFNPIVFLAASAAAISLSKVDHRG